jgi:hypothetical protein
MFLDGAVKGTLEDAGIDGDGRGLYAFRHGFCVALANGFYGDHWEKAQAADMMRHSNPKITAVYYKILKHQLDEKAKQSKPLSSIGDYERKNPTASAQIRKGRSGTDANGPFRGLAKHQQKQYFPNDHARVHASPCSRHVTRSHMIKDRHGTLTAPRRDNETQTKREIDQHCLSFGFTSLGHWAPLITVSEPLFANTSHARVATSTKPGLLPPEGMGRNQQNKDMLGFLGRSGSVEAPQSAVRRKEAQSNPAR